MKRILFAIVMLMPFMASAQKKIEVPDSILQNVVKTAFEYIKVTFPADELSVSYCFEETDYGFPLGSFLTGKRKEIAEQNHLELNLRNYNFIDPIYSTMLFDIFNVHNSNLKNPKYEVWFAIPLGGMIICNVYNFGKRLSEFGGYTIYLFNFDINKRGAISTMIKGYYTLF